MNARLLDFGRISPVRTQAIYHAVAECAAPDGAPTLCVLSPDRPYVSIGYHQEAARELELEACRREAIPVVRRKVGGGAVLLDSDQLFFHLIVPVQRLAALGLPLWIAQRYPRLVAPAIAAYRRLGVAAEFRPASDIRAGGKKIGGTGAGDVGDAFVFVGSMMLRFDHGLMARLLRLADESMREGVRRAIAERVTSLEALLPAPPSIETVREALIAGFETELGMVLEPGSLTPEEESAVAAIESEFASDDWLHRVAWTPERARRLFIDADVLYVEVEARDRGASVVLRVARGRIDEVAVRGGAPGEAATLRRRLVGASPREDGVGERIGRSIGPAIAGLARRAIAAAAA